MKKRVKGMQIMLTPTQQELVNATAEVFIRFYSDLYYEQPSNKLYLDAIEGNIKEWVKDHQGSEAVFNGAVIQTLCMTLINMLDQGDEE